MSAEPRTFAVFSFASTHEALDAETLLGDLGIDVVPIPAPPAVSPQCGIALRVAFDDEASASEYLLRAGIIVSARSE